MPDYNESIEKDHVDFTKKQTIPCTGPVAQLGVGGLVDVNLGARSTKVPENPNTRYAYIQGSIIEHAVYKQTTPGVIVYVSWGEVLMGVASYGE